MVVCAGELDADLVGGECLAAERAGLLAVAEEAVVPAGWLSAPVSPPLLPMA